MATPRFYYPDRLKLNQSFKLPDNLTHYAMRVLRLNNGDQIILFDNYGGQYLANLDIHGKNFYVIPYEHQALENELAGQISLFQGIASGDKMDWIIEKAVELGVYEFYPLTTQRSIIKLNQTRTTKRLAHWQTISNSASEQCGRNRIMQVHEPISLEEAMQHRYAASIFCHPEGNTSLAQCLHHDLKKLSIFIGPEGGWSDTELAIAKENNLLPIKFGNRVLRTETAGLAITAACCAVLGWQ